MAAPLLAVRAITSADEELFDLLFFNGYNEETQVGASMLRIKPEALTLLSNEAFKANNFTLRSRHLEQVQAPARRRVA